VSRYVAAFTGEASSLPVQVVRATGDGRYHVALGTAEIEVSGPQGLAPGDARLLMLRPEVVSFAEIGVPGRIHSIAFLGAAQHCEVDVEGGRLLVLTEPNRQISPGETVHLKLDPAQSWLMPEAVA
jgi:ABC-type Fe3+/spermidine/putrescine transport system ATPase subunit